MTQAEQDRFDDDPDPEGRERLKRFIADHIARGNKPDYERAQRGMRELEERFAKMEPICRTEEEAQELIDRYCGRRSIVRDFPVTVYTEEEWEAKFGA
jgi:hypothetical protein